MCVHTAYTYTFVVYLYRYLNPCWNLFYCTNFLFLSRILSNCYHHFKISITITLQSLVFIKIYKLYIHTSRRYLKECFTTTCFIRKFLFFIFWFIEQINTLLHRIPSITALSFIMAIVASMFFANFTISNVVITVATYGTVLCCRIAAVMFTTITLPPVFNAFFA